MGTWRGATRGGVAETMEVRPGAVAVAVAVAGDVVAVAAAHPLDEHG